MLMIISISMSKLWINMIHFSVSSVLMQKFSISEGFWLKRFTSCFQFFRTNLKICFITIDQTHTHTILWGSYTLFCFKKHVVRFTAVCPELTRFLWTKGHYHFDASNSLASAILMYSGKYPLFSYRNWSIITSLIQLVLFFQE